MCCETLVSMIFFSCMKPLFFYVSGMLVGTLSSQKYLLRHALEREKDGMDFLYSLMDAFSISNWTANTINHVSSTASIQTPNALESWAQISATSQEHLSRFILLLMMVDVKK